MFNSYKLEKWSFLWSVVRMLIAAIALFLGGTSPIWLIASSMSSLTGIVQIGLTVCWIISGLASLYLLFRWVKGKRAIFGRNDTIDSSAFLVLAISGLNLGIAGVYRNVGMMISTNHLVFILVGIIYIVIAAYLFQRWRVSDKKIF